LHTPTQSNGLTRQQFFRGKLVMILILVLKPRVLASTNTHGDDAVMSQ